MCCIFGVGFLNGHRVEDSDSAIGLISLLFKEAESGGRRAAGLSIMREQTTSVLRRGVSASELVESDEYIDFMEKNLLFEENSGNKLMSIIGHCRWPTKGSASNNFNNHPQVINNIIGVHNGVISNDDSLFSEFSNDFKRIAQVDTEIIFQLIAHFAKEGRPYTMEAIKKSSELLMGSYACAVQNSQLPFHLYLFRSSNPIRVMLYKKLGIVIFATRAYFIDKAIKMLDEDPPEPEEIEMMDKSGLALNLFARKYSKFKL